MLPNNSGQLLKLLRSIPYQPNEAVIKVIQHRFSRFGVAEEVLSDSDSCFASAEYIQFAVAWNFKRITLSPLYPRSNGLVERIIKTIKNVLRKSKDPSLGLLIHRTTLGEHGLSPAEMLMERK